MSDTFNVTMTGVTPGAAEDALLAIEAWAERWLYGGQEGSPERQARWNELGAIVLPLREAMDSAIAEDRP